MSMLPKISKTITTSDGYTKHISTMGDTTHVMVNDFCYHIRQMADSELRDACVQLIMEAKKMAQEDTQFGIAVDPDDEPRRGLVNMDGTIEYFDGEY